MSTEPTVQIPVSILNLMKGQCGNITVFLHRLGYELAQGNIEAADKLRSEISYENEYLQKYLSGDMTAITDAEFLTAESRAADYTREQLELNPKIKLAATQSVEAVALYDALDMAYTLDGQIPCRLATMLKDRLGEMRDKLISVVQTHDSPF